MVLLPRHFPQETSRIDELHLYKVEVFYQKFVIDFQKQYGFGHFVLAAYAAIPAVITPDLLYKIWLNFPRYQWDEKSTAIHRIAVADVLLSSLFQEIGHELYEMNAQIRTAFLEWLVKETGTQSTNYFGLAAPTDLAHYLQHYISKPNPGSRRWGQGFTDIQEWTALSYFDHNKAYEKLAKLVSTAKTKEEKLSSIDAFTKMTQRVGLLFAGEETRSDVNAIQQFATVASAMKDFILNDTDSFLSKIEQYDWLTEVLKEEKIEGKEVIEVEVVSRVEEAIQSKKQAQEDLPEEPTGASVIALIVAIDNYPIAHHRLNGCVNDAQLVVSYLESNYEVEDLVIQTLFNEQATKANIIAAFEVFQETGPETSCLFYFAGHGSQVVSPKEFRHLNPDGKLDTLVCYDSRLPGGYDLMDKELSYLIWEFTNKNNPHFVTVFDSSNIAQNTRSLSAYEGKSRFIEIGEKPLGPEHFYGVTKYQANDNAGSKSYTPPIGRHLHITASKPGQFARELRVESKTHGVFTYNFIKQLEQSNGIIIYSELLNPLQRAMLRYAENQSPQIAATVSSDTDLFFLGKLPTKSSDSYEARYDQEHENWIVNVGELHGISQRNAADVLFELNLDGKKVTTGITTVYHRSSVLEDVSGLDIKEVYQARLLNMQGAALLLTLAEGSDKRGGSLIIDEVSGRPSPYYEMTTDLSNADYWIHAKDDGFFFTKRGGSQPFWKLLKGFTSDNARTLLAEAEAIAAYQTVLDMNSAKTTINNENFSIELYRISQPGAWEEDDDCPADLVDWKNDTVFYFDYDSREGKWLIPALRLKISNTSENVIYCSALNLSSDYGITNKFLPLEVLKPGEECWLIDQFSDGTSYKSIPLNIEEGFIRLGINELSEYIKLFISTTEIFTDHYNQDSLSLELDSPTSRSGRTRASQQNKMTYPTNEDWTAVNIPFIVTRPTDTNIGIESTK